MAPELRNEELRHRFRALAAALERVHDEWQDAAVRDDFLKEKELIARETELLAEIDQVTREFRERIDSRLPRQ